MCGVAGGSSKQRLAHLPATATSQCLFPVQNKQALEPTLLHNKGHSFSSFQNIERFGVKLCELEHPCVVFLQELARCKTGTAGTGYLSAHNQPRNLFSAPELSSFDSEIHSWFPSPGFLCCSSLLWAGMGEEPFVVRVNQLEVSRPAAFASLLKITWRFTHRPCLSSACLCIIHMCCSDIAIELQDCDIHTNKPTPSFLQLCPLQRGVLRRGCTQVSHSGLSL